MEEEGIWVARVSLFYLLIIIIGGQSKKNDVWDELILIFFWNKWFVMIHDIVIYLAVKILLQFKLRVSNLKY